MSGVFEGSEDIAVARDLTHGFLTDIQAVHGLPVSGRAMGMVQLVVSELVTNARKYAPGPCLLTLEVCGGSVEVTGWDSNPTESGGEPRRSGLKDCAEPACRQPIPRIGSQLCRDCQVDAQEAEEAARRASARWEAEAGNHQQPYPDTDPRGKEDVANTRPRAAFGRPISRRSARHRHGGIG